jgi:hypothetical protein
LLTHQGPGRRFDPESREEDDVCNSAVCQRCGKATWKGCGMHVERVLAAVPEAERCGCAVVPVRPAHWYPRQPFGTARR